MAERNETAVSSDESSILQDAKPRYSAKTTEYLFGPMLLLIFKYLSVYDLLLRAGLVCKSWYHVARDRELWMTVDLTKQQKLKPRDLLKLLSFSNFRIIDLHLPQLTQKERFSAHEERLLILLLRKCQCLRVLQLCRLCWRSLSTDDVQEANSSLKIKFDCCTVHSRLDRLMTYDYFPLGHIVHPLHLVCLRTCFHSRLEDIECCGSVRPIIYYPVNHRISGFYMRNLIPTFGTSFRTSFTDHSTNLMERRITLQEREQKMKMQDISKSNKPKPNFQRYINNMRQSRKCPRQKHELRPPANIVKQTNMYHQPRKGPIKRSGQNCIKQ